MFTTVLIYDFRFNYQSDRLSPEALEAISARKRRSLIGCFVIAANVEAEANIFAG